MKKIYWVVIASLILTSCGIKKYNIGYEGENGYKNEGGFSLFSPPESANSLAKAELLVSQAQINKAIADQIRNNNGQAVTLNSSLAGDYVGIFANDNVVKTAYMQHPYMSQIIEIPPGKSTSPIFSHAIPKYIMVRFSNQNQFSKYRVFANPTIYNGIKVDYGARVN